MKSMFIVVVALGAMMQGCAAEQGDDLVVEATYSSTYGFSLARGQLEALYANVDLAREDVVVHVGDRTVVFSGDPAQEGLAIASGDLLALGAKGPDGERSLGTLLVTTVDDRGATDGADAIRMTGEVAAPGAYSADGDAPISGAACAVRALLHPAQAFDPGLSGQLDLTTSATCRYPVGTSCYFCDTWIPCAVPNLAKGKFVGKVNAACQCVAYIKGCCAPGL